MERDRIMEKINNINEKIDKLISECKELDIVKELGMNDFEIKNNLSNLILYKRINLRCLHWKSNDCINNNGMHIEFTRNKNNDIECNYIECPKLNKKISLYKNYYGINNSLESSSLLFLPKNINVHIDFLTREPLIRNLIKQINESNFTGLYVYGNTGVGKSYIMSIFLNQLSYRKIYVNNVDINESISFIKTNILNEQELETYLDKLKKYQILLIDNLGTEQFKNFYHVQYLIPILEYRYKQNLPTYFISHLNIEELKNKYLNNIINNSRGRTNKKDIFKLIDLISCLSKNKLELKGKSQR